MTLLVFSFCANAFAEPASPSADPEEDTQSIEAQDSSSSEDHPAAKSAPKTKSSTSKKAKFPRGQISLNFDDADINAVMQTVLGNLLKVNYLIDPRVKGTVTFRSIAPVPYRDILPIMEVILRANGIAIVESSGIYRVIPIGDIPKESGSVHFGRSPESVEMTGKGLIQVVQIHYGSSTEITRVITPFISSSAIIVDVPKNNQIVLVDTPGNIKRLLNLINIFDNEDMRKKSPQVFVYNVQNSKAKDIAFLLHQIFIGKDDAMGDQLAHRMVEEQQQQQQNIQNQEGGEQLRMMVESNLRSPGSAMVSKSTKIFFDELTNTIIILGTPEDYKVIESTIKTIDIVPRQVVIEGAVAQILLTDDMSMGLSWAITTNHTSMGIFNIGLNTKGLDLTTNKSVGQGFNVIGTDKSGVVKAVISALASDSKAKLLASPHILVSDNREARIQVGQSVPIQTSETIASVGIPAQRTIQYKDIGIILKVKPRISDSGLVSMDITQEISSYTTQTLYKDEEQIILNKTEAKTSLVVQDGQTIVIGGLIQEDNKDTKSGIPFLSKIPIIGYLFGTSGKKKERTEIIVLLTPHVLKNQQNAADVTNRFVEKFTGKGTSQDIKKEDLILNIDPLKDSSKD